MLLLNYNLFPPGVLVLGLKKVLGVFLEYIVALHVEGLELHVILIVNSTIRVA